MSALKGKNVKAERKLKDFCVFSVVFFLSITVICGLAVADIYCSEASATVVVRWGIFPPRV